MAGDSVAARNSESTTGTIAITRPSLTTSGADQEADLTLIPISSLRPADSPRLDGEDADHARLLADSDAELPPILVHRQTMRVIDGMHRVRAALLRGEQLIKVQLFDGSDEAAFVQAVRANIRHGLPLSLADREAAATRILGSHPHWSDRALASITGLSGKTIGAIRRRTAGNESDDGRRLGRDGRIRPLDCTDGRQRASELLTLRPDATLREVAQAAGISLGTARDVRQRLRRGEQPVPARQRGNGSAVQGLARRKLAVARVTRGRDRTEMLQNLRQDPSLRFNDSGRSVLRWLDARSVGAGGWEQIVVSVPPHCLYVIADMACEIAGEWLHVAEQLRERAEATG